MNTCKTCKWHKACGKHDSEKQLNGGWCENIKIREANSQYCRDYKEDYESDALVYSYNESGGFWTGNDFGCIHHEHK